MLELSYRNKKKQLRNTVSYKTRNQPKPAKTSQS